MTLYLPISLLFLLNTWEDVSFLPNQKKEGIWISLNKDTPYKYVVRNIKQILDHYCIVLGQLVNYKKSRIQFYKDVSNAIKRSSLRL